MKGQPFELACREGSLLVSESRVMWRGIGAWALWRSQIAGMGCACAAASDEAIVYLHLRDGRRFAVEEIAPRECFRLFELLDFVPTPEVRARQDNAPLAIDLGDGHTRLVAGAQGVTLEQDHNLLWTVPRDQLLGMRVSAGTTATTAEIVTRGGGATLLENIPFATALRLLVALGAAPVEMESVIAYAPAADTNVAEPPQATRATKAASSQPPKPPRSRTTAHKEPAPTSSTATSHRHANPARPRSAEATIRPKQPSQPSGRKRANPPATPATPPPKQQQSKPSGGTPASRTQRVADSNPSPKVAPPAASVSLPPPPSPAPAAAFQAEHQPAAEETREGGEAHGLYAQRLEMPTTSASKHAGGDAITVPQAALLMWRAVLAAGALRLARARGMIARASHPLGVLRRPTGMRPRVGWLAAARGMPRPRMMSLRSAALPRAWRLSLAHTDVRVIAGSLATRWRQIVVAVALGMAALIFAGGTLVADALPIASSDPSVHGQAADLAPSQAAMPSTLRAGTIAVGSHDRAIYTLEARAGAIRWHDANP